LPAQRRPDVLAVYPNWFDPSFLQLHNPVHAQRLFRASIAAGNPMNVYLADWTLAGSGDAPRDSSLVVELDAWMEIAQVDVADLESEAAAGYSYHVLDGAYDSIFRVQTDGSGGPLADGGRLISGAEEFTVAGIPPGSDVLVVTRSHGPFRLRVEANGRDAGIWVEPGGKSGEWVESAFALPGDAIRGSVTRIRIASDDPHHSAYGSFHYWVYRR
ncbi:MAG TPA: hypothetical protein VFP10_07870, partial [Candidatus Eisenbacteria bacterium]|nr:hypothetical protein [Candidatus Eisenbacteria bacterium]